MEYIVCSQCGQNMVRTEVVNGVEKDWSNDIPVCPVCRGVQGATPLIRKRNVLGGMPWKRDASGKKVPK